MAISLAVGIIFATVLTLVFIPCLMGVVNDLRRGLVWLRTGRMPEPKRGWSPRGWRRCATSRTNCRRRGARPRGRGGWNMRMIRPQRLGRLAGWAVCLLLVCTAPCRAEEPAAPRHPHAPLRAGGAAPGKCGRGSHVGTGPAHGAGGESLLKAVEARVRQAAGTGCVRRARRIFPRWTRPGRPPTPACPT
jgi:hypothetical protein